jgi:hypothetical protein
MKNCILEYEYNDMAAPYSYFKRFEISVEEKELNVQYQLTYTDRDDIYKEDLEAEGFTGNDDESWQGMVDKTWLTALEEMLKTPVQQETGPELSMNSIHIQVDGKPAPFCASLLQWEYFIHEFTQALYESGGAEAPLTMRLCDTTNGDTIHSVTISFAHRTCILKKGIETPVNVDWKQSRKLLEAFYRQEFVEGQWTKKLPVTPGVYSDPGDGNWYPFNSATEHLSPKFKDKLRDELKKWFEVK